MSAAHPARTGTHGDALQIRKETTMRLHGNAGPRPLQLASGVTVTAALVMALAACSGSGSTAAQGPAGQAAQANSAAAPAASAPQPAPAASASGLSGRWRGQYSGIYQGHFVLKWHQSGSKLSGRITLSAPARGTLGINGTVQDGMIRFGTVGSQAITYSGSVSGDSMSGTWKVQGPNGSAGGGPWSASRA
jgi:hypothetical protein